jgi:hypothetical protein
MASSGIGSSLRTSGDADLFWSGFSQAGSAQNNPTVSIQMQRFTNGLLITSKRAAPGGSL